MVLCLYTPDFPPQDGRDEVGGMLGLYKNDINSITAKLPPSVTLESNKEIRQHGARGIYTVFRFKQLRDAQEILPTLGQSAMRFLKFREKPALRHTLQAAKKNSSTDFLQSYLVTLSDADLESDWTSPEIFGVIRLRFALRAPQPIRETNADIVLNGDYAVWNCSFLQFVHHKKPIEMKAVFGSGRR
jgi:hypothetical protein